MFCCVVEGEESFFSQSKPQTKAPQRGSNKHFRLSSALPSEASPFQKPFAGDTAALKRCSGPTQLLSADCEWETILVCLLCLLCECLSADSAYDALLQKDLTTNKKILGSSISLLLISIFSWPPTACFYLIVIMVDVAHLLSVNGCVYRRC